MSYRKSIVCLAKSVKHGGYCIAGKDLETGNWIRPVSDREDEEIRLEDCTLEENKQPNVCDIISIPLLEARPRSYKLENHLINPEHRWRKLGEIAWDNLTGLVDEVEGPLWLNGYSSYYGVNDRVPEAYARGFATSLTLIRPSNLKVCVETEGAEFGNPRRKTRATFRYDGHLYKVSVTDPIIKDRFWSRPGEHPMGIDCLICVSLGEIHEGYAYKLAAAIIAREALG
jgi:hypothetical protein